MVAEGGEQPGRSAVTALAAEFDAEPEERVEGGRVGDTREGAERRVRLVRRGSPGRSRARRRRRCRSVRSPSAAVPEMTTTRSSGCSSPAARPSSRAILARPRRRSLTSGRVTTSPSSRPAAPPTAAVRTRRSWPIVSRRNRASSTSAAARTTASASASRATTMAPSRTARFLECTSNSRSGSSVAAPVAAVAAACPARRLPTSFARNPWSTIPRARRGPMNAGSPLERLPTHERRLENGLTVLVREDHSAPVVAIVTHVRAGYFNEPDDARRDHPCARAHVLQGDASGWAPARSHARPRARAGT